MRVLLLSAAALFILASTYSPVSAAAISALAKKPIYVQAHTVLNEAGWKHRRRYGPRSYGYTRWYGPRKYGFRRWYGPPVRGSYLPYRYRRWGWRRTPVSVGP